MVIYTLKVINKLVRGLLLGMVGLGLIMLPKPIMAADIPVSTLLSGTLSVGNTAVLSTGGTEAIYYQIGGSDPNFLSYGYTGPIWIDGDDGTSLILKAIAYDVGTTSNPSSIMTEVFTFDKIGPTAPVTSVTSGSFNTALQVGLTLAPDAFTTYYTTNGSAPDTSATLYSVGNTIPIDGMTGVIVTLKAISYDAVGNASSITSSDYTFDKTGPDAPTANIPSGTYHTTQTIGLTLAGDALHTYYSLDGTTPDMNSTEYTSPISIGVSDGQTIYFKVVSYDATDNASEISSYEYFFDNTTTITIDPGSISTLVTSGVFVLPVGTTGTLTSMVTLSVQTAINVSDSAIGSTSTITLPKDLEITRSDGYDLDYSALTATNVSVGGLSGLGSEVVRGALQWGLAGHTLVFSTPITLNLYVGTALNGRTLNINRSVDGTSQWTSDGIATTTCAVSLGFCQFQATKASYYAATESQTVTTTSSSNTNSSNNGPASPPQCNNSLPAKPAIITVKASNKRGEVEVFWSDTERATGWTLMYGIKSGKYIYGVSDFGDNQSRSIKVGMLKVGRTYYFSIKANNGCMPGPESAEWQIRVGNKRGKLTPIAKPVTRVVR